MAFQYVILNHCRGCIGHLKFIFIIVSDKLGWLALHNANHLTSSYQQNRPEGKSSFDTTSASIYLT